jgi:hypothetical protein
MKWTSWGLPPIMSIMVQSIERTVADFRKTLAKVRRTNNTPEKARAFLLSAGILEKHSKSPHGVRLAKRFR